MYILCMYRWLHVQILLYIVQGTYVHVRKPEHMYVQVVQCNLDNPAPNGQPITRQIIKVVR